MKAPPRSDVVYRDVEGTLRERTRAALADTELGGNLRNASASWAASRARIAAENPFAEMRDRAREIRRGDIRDLPELLQRLETNVRAAGGTVVHARDADAASRYITGLAEERGASLIAKSKSMATEEIKLNEAIEASGRRVVETDLGEWIIQLAGQHPSHIVAPAVHLNKDQVRELFAEESGAPVPEEPEAHVAHARKRQRQVYA
jgi:L-lactate dehydrogenase complex protein LldF